MVSENVKMSTIVPVVCIAVKLGPFFFFGGVGLTSQGTTATSGLLYSPR
jgi:hypothetical protein